MSLENTKTIVVRGVGRQGAPGSGGGGVLLDVDSIGFDVTYTPTGSEPEGTIYWDDTDKTLTLIQDGTALQLGQELHVRVRNDQGTTLTNGSAVYISGRTGVFPNVKLAQADVQSTSRVLGIVTEDIANTSFGFVTTQGYVRGIKTDYTGAGVWGTTWAQGDILYVSATTPGQLTNVQPAVPHFSDKVGTVGVVSAAQGSILVIINRHSTLEDLSDVNGTALTTNGQLVIWDNDNGYFDFTSNINDYADKTANESITGLYDFNTLQFNPIVAPAWQEGLLFVDSTSRALSYYNDEAAISQQLGEEVQLPVRNVTGITIPNGTPVYITGAVGFRSTIAPAQSNSSTTNKCIGVTTHAIENNTNGYVTTVGVVNDIDTSTFTAGDELYLSSTVAGAFQNTRPTGTDTVIPVGTVLISNPSSGSIKVQLRAVAESAIKDIAQTISGPWNFTGGIQKAGVDVLGEDNIFKLDTSSPIDLVGWAGTQAQFDAQFPGGAPANYFYIITDGVASLIEAINIVYDNALSTLAALNVNDAIDELDARVVANDAKNSYPSADSTKLAGIEAGATADQTASEVPIVDAGVIITATDVEGALQENRTAIDLNTAKNSYPSGDATKVGFISITQAVDLDTLESDVATNTAKVSATQTNVKNLNDRLEEDATVTGTKTINWGIYETFDYTMTGATVFSESNLPSAGDSKVITLHMTGNFAPTYPAGWSTNIIGTYDGTVENTFVIEYVGSGTPFYKVTITQPD